MGMGTVELIMRVEEDFGIEIPDAEAELLTTPEMLCDFIAHKLASTAPQFPKGHYYCPTSHAFYAVRRELMQLGIERRRITPKASIASLWPTYQRRRNWNALGEALNCYLPPLKRDPAWAFTGLLPLGVFPIWFAISPVSAGFYFTPYLLLWWLGSYLTRSFAVHPPNEIRSVADLSKRLSPRFHALVTVYESDLWPRVRALIADELNIPLESVTRDAHFIFDLGLD